MNVTSEQIQKLQNLLDRAILRYEATTNGQPLHTLKGNKFALANYWDGKKIAMHEALCILKV